MATTKLERIDEKTVRLTADPADDERAIEWNPEASGSNKWVKISTLPQKQKQQNLSGLAGGWLRVAGGAAIEIPGRPQSHLVVGIGLVVVLFLATAGLALFICRSMTGPAGDQPCKTLSQACISGCVATSVFTVYSLGLLVLFLYLVFQTWTGRIQLLSAVFSRGDGNKTGLPVVSLSKLQIFLWTLIIVFAWLYHLATHPETFPKLPSQALMLLGISGATYLGAKQMGVNKSKAKAGEDG